MATSKEGQRIPHGSQEVRRSKAQQSWSSRRACEAGPAPFPAESRHRLASGGGHTARQRARANVSGAAAFFLLFGLALLAIDWRTTRNDWPAQFLCLTAAAAPAFGALGLLLGPAVSPVTLALPAVVGYFLLTGGLLCSRADWALGGLLTSRSPGAKLLQKAIPGSLLILGIIGWAISKALLTEVHFSWAEVSALAVASAAILAGFVVWMASIVDRSDADRRKIEEALRVSKEELDRLLGRIEEPESEKTAAAQGKLGFRYGPAPDGCSRLAFLA